MFAEDAIARAAQDRPVERPGIADLRPLGALVDDQVLLAAVPLDLHDKGLGNEVPRLSSLRRS